MPKAEPRLGAARAGGRRGCGGAAAEAAKTTVTATSSEVGCEGARTVPRDGRTASESLLLPESLSGGLGRVACAG